MTRRTTPNIELLEGKTLLSGLSYRATINQSASRIVQPIPSPGRPALLSGLSSSLTTEKSVYQAGQPIQMTFTVTNVSDHPLRVDTGPSIDGFEVLQDGKAVWRSNAGVNPLYVTEETLQPGQSLKLTATWDGVPTGGSTAATGTFVVSNQLDLKAGLATFQIVAPSSQPAAPSFPSSAPTPVPEPIPSPSTPVPGPASALITMAVTTDHPAYGRGHLVHITLTLTNVSHGAVSLTPDPSVDGFTVREGSTVVWGSTGGILAIGAQTLEPGQSINLTAVWNGRPNQPGVKKLSPGIYTVQADDSGYAGSVTIRIGRGHTGARGRAAEFALIVGHRHGKAISRRGR